VGKPTSDLRDPVPSTVPPLAMLTVPPSDGKTASPLVSGSESLAPGIARASGPMWGSSCSVAVASRGASTTPNVFPHTGYDATYTGSSP